MPVGPVVLGLFLFLVVGSALFQVLNSSMNAGIVEWKILSSLNVSLDFGSPNQRNLVYKISDFKFGYFPKYIYHYISEYFGKHAIKNFLKIYGSSYFIDTVTSALKLVDKQKFALVYQDSILSLKESFTKIDSSILVIQRL